TRHSRRRSACSGPHASVSPASAPQHFLYFLPLPQGHGSLRPGVGAPGLRGGAVDSTAAAGSPRSRQCEKMSLAASPTAASQPRRVPSSAWAASSSPQGVSTSSSVSRTASTASSSRPSSQPSGNRSRPWAKPSIQASPSLSPSPSAIAKQNGSQHASSSSSSPSVASSSL